MNHALPCLAVSTWSLHHHLGAPPITGPDEISAASAQKLLELPAQLAAAGFQTLEICHFHLPSTDAAFLAELRAELAKNAIELYALLIDGGDLNDPHRAARDFAWMKNYLPVAAQLGAQTARVIAGKGAPTPSNLAKSIASLRQLERAARSQGVQLTTENWFALTRAPEAVRQIIEEVEGLELCLDFGNWGDADKPEKYELLKQIAPLAQSCHTKAFFENGEIRREDFEKCLQLMRDAKFGGVHTLIYDSGGDEWAGLGMERAVVSPFLG